MTTREGFAFVEYLKKEIGSALFEKVDVVLCPPYTALYPLGLTLKDLRIEMGAQDICPLPGESHTGSVSPQLVKDAGCCWFLAGHWEVRRDRGDTDRLVNQKILAGVESGLKPIILIGEEMRDRGRFRLAFEKRLPLLLAGLDEEQVRECSFVYEPEWTVGVREPASPGYVADACGTMRGWIRREFGDDPAGTVRILYGGSVTPENATRLLESPEVDGLGAGRQGRNPLAFAEIIRVVARAKYPEEGKQG